MGGGCRPFLKVFTEFDTMLLLFHVLVVWPWGMLDLSFLTRGQTHILCIGKWSLNHRTTPPVFLGFPFGSGGKESACNAADLCLIPGLWRSSGEGKGYPFQYSDLENSTDSIVHGVTKSWTWLSDFHFHFSFSTNVLRTKEQWLNVC